MPLSFVLLCSLTLSARCKNCNINNNRTNKKGINAHHIASLKILKFILDKVINLFFEPLRKINKAALCVGNRVDAIEKASTMFDLDSNANLLELLKRSKVAEYYYNNKAQVEKCRAVHTE